MSAAVLAVLWLSLTSGGEEAGQSGAKGSGDRPETAAPPSPKEAQPEPLPPPPPELFDDAVRAYEAGSASAANQLYDFARAAPPTDERRAWAQLYLARELMRRGFRHAAAVYLGQVVRDRATPEAVPDAVEALRELSGAAHDELLVDQGIVATLDVAFLPEPAAAFVAFHQGLEQLRRGRERWATWSFFKLPPGSAEALRARYFTLIVKLRDKSDITDPVLDELDRLAQEPKLPLELRNDIYLALARLHFERQAWPQALAAYLKVKLERGQSGRAGLYLEEAWTRYHLGQLHAAMGILTTLDAPAFEGELLPDLQLLRAFIYRDLCQYGAARRAARSLPERYGGSLTAMRERRSLLQDARLVHAAVASGPVADAHRFFRSVEKERREVDGGGFSGPLQAHLSELYALAWREAARRFRAALEPAVEQKANQLLAAAEQARLMDYEIGLKVYERPRSRLRFGGAPGAAPSQPSPQAVLFQFEGEYWNDELRDFRFEMANRCGEARP